MPRKARIDAPGALHHIICRGIERRKLFFNDDDRDDFVERLSRIISDSETLCYAWALIPNHFHLLLRTGNVPITTVMRRLLTGYAVSFNHRHKRHGRLFQNRYKSILCQEDPYLLELVRYIHLNPLRAGIVKDLKTLDKYAYCGHSRLTGHVSDDWQAVDGVLSLFGKQKKAARRKYRSFIQKGIDQGKRPELTGGGLLRSAGGWGVGLSIYFTTMPDLITKLKKDHEAGRPGKGRSYYKSSLVIVDEVGYTPINREECNLFFRFIANRYEKSSTIITSNKAFSDWAELLQDPIIVTAILDRLLHHSVVINIKGNSYRLKDRSMNEVQ
jgi:REP element-mobilizing transposase RayT